MNKTISNLAWGDKGLDNKVSTLLLKYGFSGVDIAPTIYWETPLLATNSQLRNIRNFWEKKKIKIVAIQSLLYKQPNLTIFENSDLRKKTLEYLKGMVILGAKLGAGILVFGSPKNRLVNKNNMGDVWSISLDFFSKIGEFAYKNGMVFCVEPNPKEYGCNYINTHKEAEALVNKVNLPGLSMNIDTSSIVLNKEPLFNTILEAFHTAKYIHVSEPYLCPIASGGLDHSTVAKAIQASKYNGWLAVEMGKTHGMNILESSLQTIEKNYG